MAFSASDGPDGPEAIAEAARRLRAGGLVAFPTETVYGLGALALDPAAVARVFAAKGRPATNPLIVHVADAAMARRVVAAWPGAAERLAAAFWPGPLTLVLEKREGVPAAVTAGADTVAVRVPDHPLTLALIEVLGEPIVGPSANPSGYVSPTRAGHVRGHFGADEVFVLDGGPCRGGIESTVVDLTVDPARVLRSGLVGAEELAAVIGGAVVEVAHGVDAAAGDGRARSPGVIGPHYQPRARVVLVRTLDELHAGLSRATGSALVIGPPGVQVTVRPPHGSIGMPASPAGYAAGLYAALREADEMGAGLVIVVDPAEADAPDATWRAVRERLGRAALT